MAPGDHIGCHLYDGNQYVETTLAAFKVRAVPVNVNFRYVDEELDYLFDNADLKLVVTEPDLESRAERAAKDLAWDCPVLVADDRYEALLAAHPDTRPSVEGRGPGDLYGLWTGGTTGMPKGVMWRHDDIYLSVVGGGGNPALGIAPVADLDDVAARASADYPIPGALTLCPLMHGGGWWIAFSALLSGTYNVLIRDLGLRPGVRHPGDGRGGGAGGDDHRRRLRPSAHRLPGGGGDRPSRPVEAPGLRVGRRHPVADHEGGSWAPCCPTSS